jgi:hypothetical protein
MNGSRPVSRVLSDPSLQPVQSLMVFTTRMTWPSSPGLGDHLSRRHVAAPLMRPTRRSREASRLPSLRTLRLLGLAPGEGCLATGIAAGPGGLLHRRFTLTSRDQWSGWRLFSVALSAGHPARELPGTLLYGARTFLPRAKFRIGGDRPAN